MNNRDPLRFRAELEQHLRDGTVDGPHTTKPATAAALRKRWLPVIAEARRNQYDEGAHMLEAMCDALERHGERLCEWQTFDTTGDAQPLLYQLAVVVETREWVGIVRNVRGLSGRVKGPDADGAFLVVGRDVERYARTWPDDIEVMLFFVAEMWGEPPDVVPATARVLSREKGAVRLRFATAATTAAVKDDLEINVKAYG
jgi:hypothetical protein